ALANFQRSLALEPTGLAWGNVGATQYYRGRYSESAAAFEKALSLVPSDYVNWSNLGDALRLIPGSGAKATQAYEKGIALARSELATNPNDAAIHSSLALCLAKTGRAAEAHEHLRISLATEPGRPQLLFNAAVVANRAARPADAVGYLSRAVRAGFSTAVIRREPELANLRNRDDFDDVVKGLRRESSK
ncbi:MAG TPA: tetratricopeptide repeat protein, partial [Thermoanaerobaculia bacterium]